MRSTNNYNLNIPSGSDQVNILTQITPNFETIDGVMKANEDAGIQVATELYSNNIHALTRTKGDSPAMRFTATSNYTSGDTFTVDGVQVTALAPNGATLPDNAYVIGCEVFAILKGTRLTVWAGIRATDSDKLNGESASFYATKSEVDNVQSLAEGAATIAQNADKKVNNFIEKNHTLQTSEINLANYSDSNPFTCDSDIIATAATLTGASVNIFVQRDDGQYTPIITDFNSNSNVWFRSSVYLKKGMKVYATSSSGSGFAIARRVL